MKLAICAQGGELSSAVDQRFGRCPYFVILDTESKEVIKSIPNSAAGASGGAGTQTARLLFSEKVDAVAVGNVGPNAANALNAAGIKIYSGINGTVEEALDLYLDGKLSSSPGATVDSHHGSKQ